MSSYKELAWILLLSIVGIFFILFTDPGKVRRPVEVEGEPEVIERTFQNGNSISVEVDESITSDNWECTGDCSGHRAGYEWAEDKDITDPEDCGGNSVSFIEGCEAYANEY